MVDGSACMYSTMYLALFWLLLAVRDYQYALIFISLIVSSVHVDSWQVEPKLLVFVVIHIAFVVSF